MQLAFEAATHTYRLEGRPVPSVTQIIEEQLDDWSMVPPEVRANAMKRGQLVHEAVALLVRDDLDWASLDESIEPFVAGARNFLLDTGVVPLTSETAVANTLGYAGTPDLVAIWRDATGLFDFKSGSVPRSAGPQTAAYVAAYKSTHGVQIKKRYAVQLNPSLPRGYKVCALTNPADWSVFLSAFNCWSFRHGR